MFKIKDSFVVGECIQVHYNKAVDNPMKPKILIIDIIIWWKLLWDQRPQTIRILHEWNTETPHFQSKRVLLQELLTCSCEDRLPNRLIQITRIDQTLPILIQSRPFLLTWINVNSSLDKYSHAQYELKLLIHRTNNTNRWILTYLNKILSLLLTWINFNPRMDN